MSSRCVKCGAEVSGSPRGCPVCGEPLGAQQPKRDVPPSRLDERLARLGFIEEVNLTAHLSRQHAVPSIYLEEFAIAPEVVALVPGSLAWRHRVMPVNRVGASLVLAMVDPGDSEARGAIRNWTHLNVEVVVASERSLFWALERYYPTHE